LPIFFYHKLAQSLLAMGFGWVVTPPGFIHVHHIIPLSEINQEYEVNPIQDLRPLCPNCHAMIHRKYPPFTIEEIKDLLSKN
ncbi:HNH endonuclease, partial [Microcoleus sp. Pol12A4]|uniref:HNH endonuclease n=1 Tax=Microcoleus sp. Pol12A4 TaxID=3055391 RepID=UPI002FD0F293